MDFDGKVRREGVGVGIWVRPPEGDPKLISYKMYFDCRNNVVEYGALVLGLKVLKDLRAKKVYIYGDSKLIINQVKEIYRAKHPRLRSYKNLVLDLLESFKEYSFLVIPRKKNAITDALGVSVSVFKIPIYPNGKYEIEVKHRPAIPYNINY